MTSFSLGRPVGPVSISLLPIQQGHAACAAKISALAADLEAKEQAKREQLENARAIVKAFSNQALEDIAEPLNGTVKDAERYNRRLDVDGEFNKDTHMILYKRRINIGS